MRQVTVYTRPMCPFCVRALALLEKKGVKAVEISAAFDEKLRSEMIARANGRRTYPQIFIGETHVGGFEELDALDRAGELDALLNAA
jgi:glutaredoxin 3